MLKNSVLPMGSDTISDVSCLQILLTHHNEKLRMTFGVGYQTMLIVNILFKISIFPIIDKKNNQSSVSDADQEITTLGSTDNARNSVNLISGIIHLPSGWDFSGLHRRLMIDSILHFHLQLADTLLHCKRK